MTDDPAKHQVDALPVEALAALAPTVRAVGFDVLFEQIRKEVHVLALADFIAIPRGLAPYFDGFDADLTTPIGVFDTHKVTGYLACPITAAALATLLGR